MSTEAFGSRRVAESLRAVGKYIEKALDITEGVSPGETSVLTTQRIKTPPITSLENVIWTSTGKPKITLGTQLSTEDVQVSGDNLIDIELFKLTGPGPNPTQFTSTIIAQTKTGFTATIDVDGSSPGSYHATATNIRHETFLLRHACEIERRDATSPSDLQLGALFPNRLFDKELNEVILVVLRGQSKGLRFWIENIDGTKTDWEIRRLRQQPSNAFSVMYKDADFIALSIAVPDLAGDKIRLFTFVAETPEGTRDGIVFHVLSR